MQKTNKEVITEIIIELENTVGLNWSSSSKFKLTRKKLIECWSKYRDNSDYEFYGYSCKSSVSRAYKRIFSNLPKKSNCERYKNYVLRLNNYKYCRDCFKLLDITNFSANKGTIHGKNNQCKHCAKEFRDENKEIAKEYSIVYRKENKDKLKEYNREYNQTPQGIANRRAAKAKCRAAKLQRTPSWAEDNKIKEFYINCPTGYHVDHKIPLQGKLVSGLHVIDNLQYLTAADNLSKGNRYIIE